MVYNSIYANIWGILMGSMLLYIAAPWIRHGIGIGCPGCPESLIETGHFPTPQSSGVPGVSQIPRHQRQRPGGHPETMVV